MTDPDRAREFTITRVFDASREEVFRAWTEPDQAALWFGPEGCTTPRDTITMDLRPGGEWRATMVRDDNGERYPTGGVYREIVAPERLVFTWADPTGPDGAASESLVTITLADLGGKTGMTFHQAGFATDEDRTGVQSGWTSSLDRLAAQLGRSGLPVVASAEWEPAALSALVGHWRTSGRTVARPEEPSVEITGTDDYRWLPGEFFLEHRVDVRIGEDQVDVLEVIGERDPESGGYLMRSFDHLGTAATMVATADDDGVWTFAGPTVRATLAVAPDGRSMAAVWERADEGSGWERWMEMEFVRAG